MDAKKKKVCQYLSYCLLVILVSGITVCWYYHSQALQIKAFHADQFFFAGQYTQAASLYAEAVAAGLRRETVLARLGDAYLSVGQLENAQPVFVLLTRQNPGNAQYMLKLAELYALEGRYLRAHVLIQSVIGRRPDWHTARFVLARILTMERRFDEAIFEYDHVLNHHQGGERERQ